MSAPKGNKFNPNGRPQKPIDWTQFEQLCELQCTQSEIASFLKVHPNTLSDRVLEHYGEDYSTTYKKYAECGKCSLRRHQFVLSKKNASMAIWLGKQWLGQKDISKEELYDIGKELIDAVREIEGTRSGVSEISRSSLENKSLVFDQGFPRQENTIQSQLGTKRAL